MYCCIVVLVCCCVVVLLFCHVVVLVYCFVVVLFVFKRLVVCCSYDIIICHNNHIIINNMTKSASAKASKTPPKNGLNASEKLQHVPEEISRRKKTGP